jgi:hypothetical protein
MKKDENTRTEIVENDTYDEYIESEECKVIREKFIQIQKDVNGLRKNKNLSDLDVEMNISEQYKDLYEEYPFVIKKICKMNENDDQDIDVLYKMIDTLERIKLNNVSENDAEVDLGKFLSAKYLKK